MRKHCAQLAQLVEQRTENPCVSGSIPELGILIYYGILAQVVEHSLEKENHHSYE